MQLTLDNRMAQAEKLVLELEELGYRFKISRHADGREVYLFQASADAISNIDSSRKLQELQKYKNEVCAYMTDRAKRSLNNIRAEIGDMRIRGEEIAQ